MLTLGTQRDLTNDMLIKGIIDSVVTVNQFYAMLPFKGIQGNALAYNRESFTDQMTLVGTIDTRDETVNTINKDQQTFTRHSTELTTIIGDAQVNGLIQAVGSDYNDATAVQVAAKAKGLGRTYMNTLINGQINSITAVATGATVVNATYLALINANADITYTGGTTGTLQGTGTVVVLGVPFQAPLTSGTGGVTLTATGAAANNLILRKAAVTVSTTRKTSTNGAANFEGIENFVLDSENFLAPSLAAASETNAAAGDRRLSYLDQIIDRVHDKDGMVDYLMMNSGGVRKITAAFRGVGTGFDMMDVKTSSGNVMSVQSYRGVPIFRNDFINSASLAGFAGGDNNDSSFIYAGTIDDGSLSHGICGLTALKSAGMQVQRLGAMEDSDADITRVKWYCGLAHFSELGLVRGHMA